jgi:tetratricopeptide (TPR) repeat protein
MNGAEAGRLEAAFVGREAEMATLKARLDDLGRSKGSVTLISGEPGLGKTRLVEEFKRIAAASGAKVISASAGAGAQRPFRLFAGLLPEGLIEGRRDAGFDAVFAIDGSGALLAKAMGASSAVLDGGAFASVLSAVQGFARDSLGGSDGDAGLHRLDYGRTRILLEHGKGLLLAALPSGEELPEMRAALRRAIADIGPGGATGASLEARLGELASLRFRSGREMADASVERERTTIADVALENLAAVASKVPTVLVLEDVQWSDAPSLFVLNYVARAAPDSRFMVLMTIRPSEDAAKTEAVLAVPGASEGRIELGSFGEGSVRALADGLLGPNDVPAEFLSVLRGKSGGNPFFVVELLRQMVRDGAIVKKDGRCALTDASYALPSSVEDVARRRFDSLEPELMALAEYAACIGQEFDFETVKSFEGTADAEGLLAALQSQGIVRADGNRWTFVHAILRDVAYSGIGERWRRAHHLRIGSSIESGCGDDPYASAYELANHFSAGGDRERTLKYCPVAAGKAEDAFAYEMARDYYAKALALLAKPSGENEARTKVECVERLSHACAILGDYDDAIRHLDSLDLASLDKASKVRILTRYGYIHNRKSNIDASVESLDKALAILGDDRGDEYGRICITQGNNWWYKGQVEKARGYIDSATEVFKGKEDKRRDLAEVLRVSALVQAGMGDFAGAIASYTRSLDIAREFKDERRVAAMLGNLGNVHAAKGDLAASLAHYEQGFAILKKLRHKHNMAVMSLNMGATYYALGKLSKARGFFKEAAEVLERIGDPYGMATAYMNTGIMEYMVGNWDEAEEMLEKALKIGRTGDIKQMVTMVLEALGALHMEKGDFARAEEFLLASHEMAKSNGQNDIMVSSFSNLAELHARRGDLSKAVELATEGVRLAESVPIEREGAFAKRSLGNGLSGSGRHAEALDEFRKAREALTKMDERAEIAMTDYYWGVALARAGDAKGARERLDLALAAFRESEMGAMIIKVETALSAL